MFEVIHRSVLLPGGTESKVGVPRFKSEDSRVELGLSTREKVLVSVYKRRTINIV